MKRLEVCVDSLDSALAAHRGGADRLELCGELGVGGLTPEPGLLEGVTKQVSLPLQIMIRPRAGGFVYSANELQTMVSSIRFIKHHWPNITGFVTGVLTVDNQLDSQAMQRLIETAAPYPVTLHRAFDRTKDLEATLEQCIGLGIERILTSGGVDQIYKGIHQVVKLFEKADGRIVIMPGGGLNLENVVELIKKASFEEVHFSAKVKHNTGKNEDDVVYRASEENINKMKCKLR